MPEATKLAVVEPINLPAVQAAEVKEREFVQTMVVTDIKGNQLDVAINAVANRAKGQILLTKVRLLYEKTLDDYSDAKVTPSAKEIKMLAETGALLSGWSEEAYGEGKLGGDKVNALERIAFAAAAGGAAGKSVTKNSYTDRLLKIQQIGKKAKEKKVTPIETDEKPKKS